MGKRGPKKQPIETKQRRGSYRRDRDGAAIGGVEKETPPIPEWLDARAVECWEMIAPWLERAGLLTRLDQVALALWCEALADYLLARKIVDVAAKKADRFLTITDKGNIIQHPAVGVQNKAWQRVLALCREFGLTPSARAGLSVQKSQDEDDPLTALMRKYAAN